MDELEGFCPRAPLKSPLLWGEYELLWASSPGTAGGPFRSALGQVVFPGQRISQTLAPPNTCINQVAYKALGFVPGAARQVGEIEARDGATFSLTFPAADAKRPGGLRERVIRVAYLDERMR